MSLVRCASSGTSRVTAMPAASEAQRDRSAPLIDQNAAVSADRCRRAVFAARGSSRGFPLRLLTPRRADGVLDLAPTSPLPLAAAASDSDTPARRCTAPSCRSAAIRRAQGPRRRSPDAVALRALAVCARGAEPTSRERQLDQVQDSERTAERGQQSLPLALAAGRDRARALLYPRTASACRERPDPHVNLNQLSEAALASVLGPLRSLAWAAIPPRRRSSSRSRRAGSERR